MRVCKVANDGQKTVKYQEYGANRLSKSEASAVSCGDVLCLSAYKPCGDTSPGRMV